MQLNLTQNGERDLLVLAAMLECSPQEAVDSAMTLMRWAAEERAKGLRVGAIDDQKSVIYEIVLPVFDNLNKPQ